MLGPVCAGVSPGKMLPSAGFSSAEGGFGASDMIVGVSRQVLKGSFEWFDGGSYRHFQVLVGHKIP